jgi:hypothetical protein
MGPGSLSIIAIVDGGTDSIFIDYDRDDACKFGVFPYKPLADLLKSTSSPEHVQWHRL